MDENNKEQGVLKNNTVGMEFNRENSVLLADMDEESATPAMRQYLEIKRAYMDYLLFYRMGDFYELFFEDAVTVSGAVGLALTHRSKVEDKNIPMCGVPYHAYEMYMQRLIKMGYKVAICEQMEDPAEAKKRGYKAVVRREVVRLVTSGTVTEDTILEAKRNNFIAAVYVRTTEIGLSWLDISTGDFYMQRLAVDKRSAVSVLSSALARLSPVELLIEDRLLEYPDFFGLFGEYREQLSVLAKSLFNQESAIHTLLKMYKVQTMDSFGDFSPVELVAGGVLLGYVENTQKGHLPQLKHPRRILGADIMEIDAATRRSLELLAPISANGVCLLDVMDKTVTGVGGRLLAERLASPIMDIKKINDRLDVVTFFIDNPNVRREIRNLMRQCLDMERAVQRLSLGRGGPRDLYDLAVTLKIVPYIQNMILGFAEYQKDSVYALPPQALTNLANSFFNHSALQYSIESTLRDKRDDLPNLARNGGFVRDGAYEPLDYLRNIREESNVKCEQLRQKYVEATGVTALKMKNNTNIGYFVEVPSKFADKLLDNKMFIHRQSVLNAVRFTTIELSEIENEVNSSLDKALEMELKIYDELIEHVMAQASAISQTAEAIAQIDVAAAMAELAVENGYVRPVIDNSLDFEVIEGRHPVVEYVIKREGQGSFVGNNCKLNADMDRIWLLTGPNMAGKSTFLRQNALIAIMAQMGSYVPAKSAKIGVINRLYSRVGASDDLARGRSTFMVEMVETAAILNRADERSFVILDEIGRGTATFDGLSIAWAVVEHLSEVNKCRTLFATHYHELTKLYRKLSALSLHCMKIKEFNGDVVFMHEVIEGAADRSYGIHVARLAGLPSLTLKRAEQVLKLLEDGKQNKVLNTIQDDLPLFEVLKKEVSEPKEENPLIEEIKMLDIDNLSPREALDKLYELKKEANKN